MAAKGDSAHDQDTDRTSAHIADALTRQLFAYGTTAAVGTATLSAVLAVLALQQNSTLAVVSWTLIAVMVALVRGLLVDRFISTHEDEVVSALDQRWLKQYLILSCGSALVWCAGGMALFPATPGTDQTLFVVVLAGVAAVAAQTLFQNKLAVACMIVLPTLPAAFHLLAPQVGEPSLFGALIVALFWFVLLRLASNSHALLRKSILFEYESRQLIAQSEGLICTHDREGKLLGVNQAVCSSLGYSQEEMVGKPLSDFIADKYAPLFEAYLTSVWSEGRAAGHLHLLDNKGLTRIWSFRNRLYQPLDGDNYVIGHAQDVTESARLQRWLRETIDLLPAEFSRFDARGNLVLMNKMFEQVVDGVELGMSHEQILRMQVDQNRLALTDTHGERWIEERLAALEQPELTELTEERAGDEWISIRARRSLDGALVSIGTDISKDKALENELRVAERELEARVERRTRELQESQDNLRQSEQRLKDYASTAADYYWELDGDLRYQHVEGRFEELTGLSPSEVIGEKIGVLCAGHVADPEAVERGLEATFERRRIIEDAEVRWTHADGSERIMHVSGQPFYSARGEFLGYRGSGHDVTELTLLAERLEFEANHDALTGLYNRRQFERTLSAGLESARRNDEIHALGYIDLDQFKIINDTCGHLAGDELLRQLGTLLRSTITIPHTLARLGGDEFGVLLTHCSLDTGRQVANLLLTAIENFRFSWEDQQFAVGASIGLIPLTKNSGGMTNVMQAADAACYTAKSNGKNQVVVQEPGDNVSEERREEIKLISQVVSAIDRDELQLTVQPIVPSERDGFLYDHFEILVALKDSSGRTMRAGQFMELAERYGLAVRIDRWVVAATLDWLKAHPSAIEGKRLCSINLSGTSLGDPAMPDFVLSRLQSSGVDPRKICFEITETSAISNWQQALSLINLTREKGCRFALDDFGTGLSSFAYLKKLPVDYVKIDGAFVSGIEGDQTNLAIVKSICEVARSTGKQTVAEFVDTPSAADLLQKIGVDYLQGYGIGKPEPIDVLDAGGSIQEHQSA